MNDKAATAWPIAMTAITIAMIVRVVVVPIAMTVTTIVMIVVPTVVAASAATTAIRVTQPTRTTTSTAPIAKSVPNARVAAFVATSIPSRTDGEG